MNVCILYQTVQYVQQYQARNGVPYPRRLVLHSRAGMRGSLRDLHDRA
jgi:hypothetical protein